MRPIAFMIPVALCLAMLQVVQAANQGNEAGTLKGIRGVPTTQPAGTRVTPGKRPGLIEEEGISHSRKKRPDAPQPTGR